MSLFTWSRYSDSSGFVISPITVVSSANFSILVCTWQDKQSCVKKIISLVTEHSPEACQQITKLLMISCRLFLQPAAYLKENRRSTDTWIEEHQNMYLIEKFWWDNRVKSRAKINKKDLSVSIWAVEMFKNVNNPMATASSTDLLLRYANWNI